MTDHKVLVKRQSFCSLVPLHSGEEVHEKDEGSTLGEKERGLPPQAFHRSDLPKNWIDFPALLFSCLSSPSALSASSSFRRSLSLVPAVPAT